MVILINRAAGVFLFETELGLQPEYGLSVLMYHTRIYNMQSIKYSHNSNSERSTRIVKAVPTMVVLTVAFNSSSVSIDFNYFYVSEL